MTPVTPVTKVLLGLGLFLVVAASLVAGAVIYATWFDTEATESSVGLRTHVAGDFPHYHGLDSRPGPPGYSPPQRPPDPRPGPPGYGPPRRPPLPGGGGLRRPHMIQEDVKALVETRVIIGGGVLGACLPSQVAPFSPRYIGAGTWIVEFGACAFTVDDRTGKVSP